MALALIWIQKQVDGRVNQHPDWYFSDKKIFEKMEEEKNEIQEALLVYKQSPTEENMKALKTEIGDELFALVCLANKNNILLEECFNLMMEKNENRAKNNYKKENK